MPTFVVENQSSHSAEQAFRKVREFLEQDQDLRRLDSKYRCEFDEADRSGRAVGSQFKADLLVKEIPTGSHVSITVELPFALSFFKGKIQSTLKQKLDSSLS